MLFFYSNIRYFLRAVLISTILAPGVSLAVVTFSPIDENGVEQNSPIVLSPVDVISADVKKNRDGSLSISFELANKTEFVQPGIVWSVALVKKDQVATLALSEDEYDAAASALYVSADSAVFADTPITLGPSLSRKKTFRYQPPVNLNGEYDVYVTFANSLSLLLNRIRAGTVEFTSSGERITIQGCYLTVGDAAAQYTNLEGVDIAPGETLVAHCGVESGMPAEISATRVLQTFERRNLYGAEVSRKNGSEMIIAQNLSQVDIAIPTEKISQGYNAFLWFEKNGVPISNKMELHYVVQGKSAAIQNILPDKESYRVGDTAKMTIFWTESADGFLGVRSRGGKTTLTAPQISVYLQNERGESCTDNISAPLPRIPSAELLFVAVEMPVVRDCIYPAAIVRITDTGPSGEGTLAAASFPTKERGGVLYTIVRMTGVTPIRVAIRVAILILVLVAFFWWWRHRFLHKRGRGLTPQTPLIPIVFLSILTGASVLFFAGDALAKGGGGGGGGGDGGGGITFGGFAPGGGIPNTGSGFTIVGLTSSGSFIYGGITAGHGSGASSASRRTDAGGGGQSGGSQCVWVLGQCTSGNASANGGGGGGGGSQSQSQDFFLSRSNDIAVSLVGGNERTSNSATVTVTPQNSFSATVDLSATTITPNLPGIVYTLGDNSLVSSEYDRGSSFSVTVPGDTASGTYAIIIEGRNGGLTRTVTITLSINTLDVQYLEF